MTTALAPYEERVDLDVRGMCGHEWVAETTRAQDIFLGELEPAHRIKLPCPTCNRQTHVVPLHPDRACESCGCRMRTTRPFPRDGLCDPCRGGPEPVGRPDRIPNGSARERVVAAMRDLGGWQRVEAICERANMRRDTVRRTIQRLVVTGKAQRRGSIREYRYRLVRHPRPGELTPHMDRITDLMSDGSERTANEIATTLGRNVQTPIGRLQRRGYLRRADEGGYEYRLVKDKT